MADILEFGRKVQDLKSMRDASERQRKIDALRKVFQCTRCIMKCAKCGTQLDMGAQEPTRFATPYRFCRNCQDEYEEYRERAESGNSTPRYYWHNGLWMQAWATWLDHQKLVDQYRQSKEFLQLMQEVEEFLK
ncbi:MAG: hypothetical protein AB9873_16885 [Syntrophobacteraceae bacterium]